jgi:hypothetical protein
MLSASVYIFAVGCAPRMDLASPRIVTPSVTVDPASLVQVMDLERDPSKWSPVVLTTVSSDDGIFAIGYPHAGSIRAFKLNLDGSYAWSWQQENLSFERPEVAGRSVDRRYWVAGVTQGRDPHEFVRRFDETGNALLSVAISPVGENHFLECGQEVSDGYIFTGWSESPNRWLNPWIEKIDKNGQRIWQVTIEEWQDPETAEIRLLENLLSDAIGGCRGLQVKNDGTVTWATSVNTVYVTYSSNGKTYHRYKGVAGMHGVLLVQLDASGRERQRIFRKESLGPRLLQKGDDGYVLFDVPLHQNQHPVDTPFQPPAAGRQGDWGLHVHFLDDSLHEVGEEWAFPADNSAVKAIVALPEGGWILGICDGPLNFFSRPGLRYLNANGRISPKALLSADPATFCDKMAIARGKDPASVRTLQFSNQNGLQTATATFKN